MNILKRLQHVLTGRISHCHKDAANIRSFFWSILTGRQIQTTRPDIKRTVSNINEEPKRLLPNCQFRYFYNEFITKPEYCFDVQLLINYKFRKVFVEMLAQFKTNAYLCTVIPFKGDTSLLLI